MTLESRNANVLRRLQDRHDNATPPEWDDVTDHLDADDYEAAREELLEGYDDDDITDAMVEQRAVDNYLAKWSDQ